MFLDEKYRKAGKLDVAEFSTNFHPHDIGILDALKSVDLAVFLAFHAPGMEKAVHLVVENTTDGIFFGRQPRRRMNGVKYQRLKFRS